LKKLKGFQALKREIIDQYPLYGPQSEFKSYQYANQTGLLY